MASSFWVLHKNQIGLRWLGSAITIKLANTEFELSPRSFLKSSPNCIELSYDLSSNVGGKKMPQFNAHREWRRLEFWSNDKKLQGGQWNKTTLRLDNAKLIQTPQAAALYSLWFQQLTPRRSHELVIARHNWISSSYLNREERGEGESLIEREGGSRCF